MSHPAYDQLQKMAHQVAKTLPVPAFYDRHAKTVRFAGELLSSSEMLSECRAYLDESKLECAHGLCHCEAVARDASADFLPTLCKLAGAPLPADTKPDGEDVSDILHGQSRPRITPLLWEWRFNIAGEPFHRSPMLAIREGDWKLLLNPDRSRVELYDIPRDPTQLANMAKDHSEIVERLATKALAWQATLPKGPVEPAAGKADYPWPGRAANPRPAKKAAK